MHVIVIGAGVIGTTTAWFLREQGHTVEVLEREHAPAEKTSFANAGQLSYGYAVPWAAPGMQLKALKWMLDPNAPFKVHPDLGSPLRQAAWLANMFHQCTPVHFERNKTNMLAISEYSRQALSDLRQALPELTFDHQARGTLQLFRTAEQLTAAESDERMLLNAGVACRRIASLDDILSLEPGLASSKVGLAGALHLPNDETGDCRVFTAKLAYAAMQRGVRFHYRQTATAIIPQKSGCHRVITDESRYYYGDASASDDVRFCADAVVLCTGSEAAHLLLPLELDVRSTLYPVKGYSLTYRLDNPGRGPCSTVMDETYKVAITRLGNRVRIGGTAELSGFNSVLRPERRATLTKAVTDLFPDAGEAENAQFWTGLRPTTPTGVPRVGQVARAIGYPGVWTNYGHGTLGWTMACGCAKSLALQMSEQSHRVPATVLMAFRDGMRH